MRILPRLLVPLLLAALAACSDAATGPRDIEDPGAHPDLEFFRESARGAWSYVELETDPATGLVQSVEGYPYTTIWDVGSSLAAVYSAHRLGIIGAGEYGVRMGGLLRALERMPLFDGVTYSRVYSTRTGAITEFNGPHDGDAQRGSGWSATDLGRLLIWLRLVADQDPAHAELARRVVARLDLARLVRDGYLVGAEVEPGGGVRLYQEGRIGYEQYAARGFALWGHAPERALRLSENTLPITIFGIPLVADRRGDDHLTSEPFVLAGLEVGWAPDMRDLAGRMLRVQEERHRHTGQVTVLSEDALPDPPFYFYYYAFNHHGQPFTVLGPAAEVVVDGPRWVSAKAAHGWYALLPGEYSRLAARAVAPALQPGLGWGSGIYEGSGRPTGQRNINTAAGILEAALFATRGRPLLDAAGS